MMKHILSFDIAKGKSVYCFIDELRNTIIDATLIEHNKNEFDNLFDSIKDYPNLIIVMESTSIYHLPVENYFRSKGIDTVVFSIIKGTADGEFNNRSHRKILIVDGKVQDDNAIKLKNDKSSHEVTLYMKKK